MYKTLYSDATFADKRLCTFQCDSVILIAAYHQQSSINIDKTPFKDSYCHPWVKTSDEDISSSTNDGTPCTYV